MSQEPNTLEYFLDCRVVDDLKQLARLVVIEGKMPTRKADLIACIVQEFKSHLRDYWNALDDLQQKAVAEALYAPWFDEGGFYSKYGESPSWDERDHTFFGRIRNFSLLNLFILGENQYGYAESQKAVPDDLKVALKEFVPKPPPAKLQVEEKRPEKIALVRYDWQKDKEVAKEISFYHSMTERSAQDDLVSVLRLVDAGKIRLSEKTGRPTAGSIRAIGTVLQGGDFYPEEVARDWEETPGPIKAYGWPMLVQSAKLARLKSGKLNLTASGRKALSDPPHETIKIIWQAWLKNKKVDELQRVNAIRGQTGRGKRGMTPPVTRRKITLQALKKCPAEKWFSFGAFLNFMRATGLLLIVSEEPWELYVDDYHYGHLDGDSWALLSSRYAMVLLFEYAATLGLIDIIYVEPEDAPADYDADIAFLSRYDGLLYLRINALGAFCLDKTQSYTPSEVEIEHVLKVLPNFDVVGLKPLSPGDQIMLEQFTKKTGDTVWTINSDQILKALENGQSLNHFRSFLTHKSGVDLPQPVAVLFDDMADKGSFLKSTGTAHLIEVKDADTAQFLSQERDVSKHCFLTGERHLAVPEKSLTKFRNALRKIGYVLPK